jgi:hypothetical protein
MAESVAPLASDAGAPKKVSTADFEFGEILGEGAYGAVRTFSSIAGFYSPTHAMPPRIRI